MIVEWRINPDRATDFAEAMEPVGKTRRQTGATHWGLYQDADDPALFLEAFTAANWSEHQRQHLGRGIESDKEQEAGARAFLTEATSRGRAICCRRRAAEPRSTGRLWG